MDYNQPTNNKKNVAHLIARDEQEGLRGIRHPRRGCVMRVQRPDHAACAGLHFAGDLHLPLA